MRRPAVKMAAAMMPAAEMVATSAATMAATVASTMMTAAATTTAVAAAMTASRDREVSHRQHHCKDNGGNSQRDS
jgi:hypothetical protein